MFPQRHGIWCSFPLSFPVSNCGFYVALSGCSLVLNTRLSCEVSAQIIFTSLASAEESEVLASPAAQFSLYIPERKHVLPTMTFTSGF